MSLQMKQLVEAMWKSDFMSKSPKETLQFLDYVARVSRSWEDSLSKYVIKDKNSMKSKNWWYLLNS